jgi:NADH:ubiquinone oxidoreductase subunit C
MTAPIGAKGPPSLEREEQILGQLKERFGEVIKESRVSRRSRPEVTVAMEKIVEVATFLRDELGFDRANGAGGADYLRDQKMEVIYHVSNLTRKETRDIVLSVKEVVPRNNPKVTSLVSVWPSVENFERETFEMYGITFDGHPHLEKLFLLDNWDGPPPLRKDVRIPTD